MQAELELSAKLFLSQRHQANGLHYETIVALSCPRSIPHVPDSWKTATIAPILTPGNTPAHLIATKPSPCTQQARRETNSLETQFLLNYQPCFLQHGFRS
ncbi:hypothetical protein TNCV_3106891 [Trichonephila clavipes]|nr:hypothetical protein TNCV_3106891 [Trichonephila clavipes]